jgi:hypothetical protein
MLAQLFVLYLGVTTAAAAAAPVGGWQPEVTQFYKLKTPNGEVRKDSRSLLLREVMEQEITKVLLLHRWWHGFRVLGARTPGMSLLLQTLAPLSKSGCWSLQVDLTHLKPNCSFTAGLSQAAWLGR